MVMRHMDLLTQEARLKHKGRIDQIAVAVVEKGANGPLEIARHHSTAMPLGWGVGLLGSAITVLAAPLGIAFLASILTTSVEWAGAAAIVGRFWHDVPRDLLRTMGILLEAGPAGLVVVAVGHSAKDVNRVLSNAGTKIVTDSVRADLEADFATAIDEGTPALPRVSPTMDDATKRAALL
jgi:hypothetical protein